MPYGDYNGPNKPNKGIEGGACNVTRCQAEPAIYYNHGSHAWYCAGCRDQIGFDRANLQNWRADFTRLFRDGRDFHPQFETREEMDKRAG